MNVVMGSIIEIIKGSVSVVNFSIISVVCLFEISCLNSEIVWLI